MGHGTSQTGAAHGAVECAPSPRKLEQDPWHVRLKKCDRCCWRKCDQGGMVACCSWCWDQGCGGCCCSRPTTSAAGGMIGGGAALLGSWSEWCAGCWPGQLIGKGWKMKGHKWPAGVAVQLLRYGAWRTVRKLRRWGMAWRWQQPRWQTARQQRWGMV